MVKNAFTLIEVLIFTVLISLIFVALTSLSLTSLFQTGVARNKILSSHYAEELREWLRSQKEIDWIAFKNTYPHNSNFCFNASPIPNTTLGGGFACASNNCTIDPACSFQAVFSQLPLGKRYVHFTHVGSPDEVQVGVTVSWGEGDNKFSVPVNTLFVQYEGDPVNNVPTPTATPTPPPTWLARKPVTITNTGAGLANYQILLLENTANLISAGKMRPDCGDIRIRDQDEITLLNYWLESNCNSPATKIWVKVPSIPSGTRIIYLYYNNPTSTSESNGTNTFLFFEDFSSGLSKWTISPGSAGDITAIEPGGYLKIVNDVNEYDIRTPQTIANFAQPFIAELDFSHRFSSNYHYGVVFSNTNQLMGTYSFAVSGQHTIDVVEIGGGAFTDEPSTSTANDPMTPNIWHTFQFTISSSTMAINLDGGSVENGVGMATSGPFYLLLGGYWNGHPWPILGLAGDETWYDNIRLRQYASPAPTTSIGPEEIL